MNKQSVHMRWMVGSALVAIVSSLASPAALAQTSAATGESVQDAASLEPIVVTGTRIRRPNLESSSPLAVIDDSEFKYQGATAVDSVLNRLPQFTADANENVSNGSDGTANINLRDLGSNRVLVLVDGQRLLPSQAIDVNFIPAALVERVDVVTGGASAVYGSDAISGVVNFIMKKNLNGVRINSQYSFYQHTNDNKGMRSLVRSKGYDLAPKSVTDGSKYDLNIAAGTDFADGKGNVTVYGGYRKVRPVLQSSRDYSSCSLEANPARDAAVCGGSSNNQYGQFTIIGGEVYANSRDGQKTWVPYDSSFKYNTSPSNYIQRSDVRYTAGAFAHYELTPKAEIYGSFMFMDDHSFSQVAASALWSGEVYPINCDNPLLSGQQASLLCGADAGKNVSKDTFIGYRMTGEGIEPRRADLRHTDYRITSGVRGEVIGGINYDVNFQRAVVIYNESYKNDIDPARAKRALQVVNVNGTPTCKSVVDRTDPSCLPLDLFGFGRIDPAAYKYAATPTFTRGEYKQSVISAGLSGDLTSYDVVSPWASQGVGFAVGVERRREDLRFEADALAQAKGTTESQGSIKVDEIYTELGVPILEDLPFAKSLNMTVGYRYSKYTNDSKTGTVSKYSASTYKAELDYAPTRDVRFRASYNHAIRAPNVAELFAAQSLGNVEAQDPCSGKNPEATLAQCKLSGVTDAQYGKIPECPSATCVARSGGNPDVKPEKADTYTFGVVLTPSFITNLSLSVDFYNIKVDGYIGSVSAPLVLSQCIEASNPFFCGLFHRDPKTGVLFGTDGYVQATTNNTGYLKTSGIDLSVNYRFDLEDIGVNNAGRLNFDMLGTYLNNSITQQMPGLGTYDCAGLFGPTCGQPAPRWRHQLRTTWEMPWSNATLSLNWRYFGGTKLSSNTDNVYLKGDKPYIVNRKINAYNYFDLSGTVEVMDNIVLRAGINNLFDKDPPAIVAGLFGAFGNGNTYPGVYDPLGRTIFIGLTAEF